MASPGSSLLCPFPEEFCFYHCFSNLAFYRFQSKDSPPIWAGDRNHWIGRWKVGLHPLPKDHISSWEIGGLAVLPVGTAWCGLSSSLLSSAPLSPSLDFHFMWSPLKLWLVPSQSNKEGSLNVQMSMLRDQWSFRPLAPDAAWYFIS